MWCLLTGLCLLSSCNERPHAPQLKASPRSGETPSHSIADSSRRSAWTRVLLPFKLETPQVFPLQQAPRGIPLTTVTFTQLDGAKER